MTAKRLKILLGCYACNPNSGSEPGTGWNFVRNIAKYHDVHAIVEEGEFKENILQYAQKHPAEVRHITFYFIPRTHHELLRKIWPPNYYWFYRRWNRKAYELAVELDKKEHFDIIHQVTMTGFREPGFLWKLNKPFVWGPIGGFSQTAWCLLKGTGLHSKLYFSMRNLHNFLQKHFGYAGKKVAPKANAILVSDLQGLHHVSTYWNRHPELMAEVGTYPLSTPYTPSRRAPEEPFRICWAGQLIPLKSLEILLHAISLSRTANLQLDVLGRGPCLQKWKALTSKLGIEDKVTFLGYREHNTIIDLMRRCHVLCHTSIKEGGTATVILEALQSGLPVIALDHCGQAAVINESCGYKVPIRSRRQIIKDITEQIDFLANNEDIRHSLAIGAIQRSKEFSWDAKMQQLNRIYESAASSTSH